MCGLVEVCVQYGWASRWFVFISMAGLVVVCVHQYGWTSHGFISMAGLVMACVHQYDWASHGLCSSVWLG